MNNILPKTWQTLLDASGFVPVIIKSIERFFDASWSKSESSHKYYEMVYVKKGVGTYQIEDKTVTLGPNDIIIIKPNCVHTFRIPDNDICEFIVLYFNFVTTAKDKITDNKRKIYSEIPLEHFINFMSEGHSGAFLKLKVNQKNDIVTLLNRIIKEQAHSDEPGSEFLVYLLIMELFVLISRALKMEWERSIKDESPKLKELIRIAAEFMDNNYERDISLSDVSKYVFLSQSYFARTFKKEMGTSPINYLLKVRIERAKELLAETDTKASDIALSVGFSNQQRFNEIFKKYTKLTPLTYRKRIREMKNI